MLISIPRACLTCILILVAALVPARADKPQHRGVLSINFENDLFYNTDRNYTNGVQISWLTSHSGVPEWIVRAARLFPLFPDNGTVRIGYALGQSMYTPQDITLPNPPASDRPYAGWLYSSLDVIAESGNRLDLLGLTIGMVGPASLAEYTQKLVHRVTRVVQPEGWSTQLHNEPGIILVYQRSWRQIASKTLLTALPFDITPHAGGSFGNIFTYVDAGLTVRVGKNLLLDYGPPRIQPSLPGSGFFLPESTVTYYFFSGIDVRAIARNIFLDGNTFRDSRRVTKEPIVGDLQFGFVVSWHDLRLSYTHVLRTREFKSQSKLDNFGAINLSAYF